MLYTDKTLTRLRDREAELIQMRYNPDGTKKSTLQTIGTVWGVSRERVESKLP